MEVVKCWIVHNWEKSVIFMVFVFFSCVLKLLSREFHECKPLKHLDVLCLRDYVVFTGFWHRCS